ncbi:MAG: glycosyltransferase [Phycisphaerae bacterium]|nr:glycosyltransferase [Phycisphaerae bacterium]
MRRLRVCQLITELVPGGAERCVYELARRLDRRRFDVRVVALRGGPVADWLADDGVPVKALDVRCTWDVLRLPRLVELLRRERIDLLHTHLFHADLAGRPARSLAAVPHLVHTLHMAEGRFRPWRLAFTRLLAAGCDRLICVSESVRRWHAERSGLPPWRYTVIPNGIEAAAYVRDEQARRRLRAEWNVEDNALLVAYVGRLERQRGVDTLLAAMSHLAARGNPCRLVIVGDGPQREMVRTFVAHGEGGGHCRWVDFRRDVGSILSAADVFAMPSRWEGVGLALAEAMAAGLPVVATDVPGLSELVEPEQTGLLVEPADVVALAEAIERLGGDADLRRRLGQAGRQYVTQQCDIDSHVQAHECLYQQVAAEILRR